MSRQHCLVLLMGVAGTGKTTLARQLVRRIRAVYLDNNHIADVFFPNTRNALAYKRLRPKFYTALYKIAEENLHLGNSVLLDVPHIKEIQAHGWRDTMQKLASRTRAKLVLVRCRCAEKTLQDRLVARNEARDRWKLAHWKQFLRTQPIDAPIPLPHLDVDTETSLLQNVNKIIQYIHARAKQDR